ncbi:MAG TPA: M20/M25/M40 family metallo-hydrolase [Pseudomonadota bacterium]|nr:M20/M25/M40 family metallo-hydrolase [Pseudomonadota bacterium]
MASGFASKNSVGMWLVWGAPFAVLLALWGLAEVVQRPPAPVGETAGKEVFSEGRAMAVVRKLADEIGPHPVGSESGQRAAEWLEQELKKESRLEVERYNAEGDTRLGVWQEVNFHYRVTNVVARLAGRQKEAILLNAHYDSPVEARGASDNGVGTAAAFEAMRALCASGPLEWTVILHLNGGEEAGSGGAAGFLSHRWAQDVRAFVDIDGSGAGKANLIQTSAEVPGLLLAYAKAAKSPQATIFGNDFVSSGLAPVSGDFEPFTRAGWPGLDFAAVKDMWSVHTHLDRSERLQPGTLQSVGDTVLAVVRELAERPPVLAKEPERTVYYDVMSVGTLVYSMRTARGLAVGAMALVLGMLWALKRQKKVPWGTLLGAVLWAGLSSLFGLLSAGLSAAFVSLLLHRPHGFYAKPGLLLPSYAMAGFCGVLSGWVLWQKRQAPAMDEETGALVAWAGGLVGLGVLLGLCAVKSLGLGYLFLWWVVPGAAGLLASLRFPNARVALFLGSVAIGAAGFVHLLVGVLPAMLGTVVGMTQDPVPGDVKMAVLLWMLLVLPFSLGGTFAFFCGGPLAGLRKLCGGVAAAGLVALAVTSPYTAERPKRVFAVHLMQEGKAAVLLQTEDYVPMGAALDGLPDFEKVEGKEDFVQMMPPGRVWPYGYKGKAEALAVPPPVLEVLEQTEHAEQGTRTVKVRLVSSGWIAFLHVPRKALKSWSLLQPLPEPIPGQNMILAAFVAPNPQGQVFSLELVGKEKWPISLVAAHVPWAPSVVATPWASKELTDLVKRLPAWTSVNARVLHAVKTTL